MTLYDPFTKFSYYFEHLKNDAKAVRSGTDHMKLIFSIREKSGKMEIGQEKVRKKSGNFILGGLWEPCI